MNPKEKTPFFIVNPVSGGGRGKKQWPKIQRKIESILGAYEVVFTQGSKDATVQTQKAIEAGYRSIISVGGDGTLNEVVNGLFSYPDTTMRTQVTLGLIPLGSGDDFHRSLELSTNIEENLERIKRQRVLCVDVGHLTYTLNEGGLGESYFVNIVDFGLGGSVMKKVNASTKRFGGRLTYLYYVLQTLLTLEGQPVTLEIAGQEYHFPKTLIGIVANGRFFGSGLCVAPMAELSNGVFEVMIVEKLSMKTFLKILPKLYMGKKIDAEGVSYFQTSELKVTTTSQEPMYIEADGEQPGKLPVSFKLLPDILRFWI